MLPIINHLLREQEAGTLSAGVRAIIIYPMNALANDQMKRMRALFKNYPSDMLRCLQWQYRAYTVQGAGRVSPHLPR
ncbi:MAG: hypothetical protein ACLU9R_07475 [Faecalibacterium sp.]